MELNFDKLFNLMTIALNVARLHPHIKRGKVWLLQIIFRVLLVIPMYCLIMQNIIYYDLKNHNFLQTCKSGVLAIASQMATIHFMILVFHQNSLINLIKDINKDYKIYKSLTPDEQAIINKYVNLGRRVCKQWFIMSVLALMQFILKSVSFQLYYYCVENEYRLIPIYDLTYPAIIEENKNIFSVYLVTYTLLALFGVSLSVMYTAYVPLGPIMMLHACAQLEIAKAKIDTLFVELDDNIIKKKLQTIIKHLQYTYSFVDRITAVFNVAYEVTLKLSALILPVTVYAFIEGAKQGEVSMEVIVFVFGGVLISSTPCYYSDLLQELVYDKSNSALGEDIRIALYSCGWERHYDRSTRKTLLIMLQYALRPVAIKTLFRTLCLDALTDLFRQSYTIFNLMNAMFE